MLSILMIMQTVQVQANIIDQYLKEAFTDEAFIMPDHRQLQQFQTDFLAALQEKQPNEVHEELAEKSAEVLTEKLHKTIQAPFIFLSDSSNKAQGKGFIAIRSDQSKAWFLQAPHAKSDLYTGKIASQLFLEGPFKAAIWNTQPRKRVDMAHQFQSYWQVTTQVFAEYYPQARIIQLHGFATSKRKTTAAKNMDIIVSAGHNFPPLWVQKVTDCLKEKLPYNISLYPYKVSELGATRNSQGQLLRSLGHAGFLHLEMNKKVRKNLLKDQQLRQQLLFCLAAGE